MSNILKEYNEKEYQKFLLDYKVLKKHQHISFGAIQLLKNNQSGEIVFTISKNMTSEKQLNGFIKEMKQRHQELQHENMELIHGFHKVVQNGLCGSTINLTLIGNYMEKTLELEIQNRVNSDHQFFSESEILYILGRAASALLQQEKQGLFHGDINTQQVYFSVDQEEQGGELKLYDNGLLALQTNPLVRAQGNRDNLYLSPEQMSLFKSKNLKDRYNEFKSDVFSLGITVLCAASLKSSAQFYDWIAAKINFVQIQDTLTSLLARYSPEFVQELRNMLNEQVEQRSSFEQVVQFVDIREQQINNDQQDYNNYNQQHQGDYNNNYNPQQQQQQQQLQMYQSQPQVYHPQTNYNNQIVEPIQQYQQPIIVEQQHQQVYHQPQQIYQQPLIYNNPVIEQTQPYQNIQQPVIYELPIQQKPLIYEQYPQKSVIKTQVYQQPQVVYNQDQNYQNYQPQILSYNQPLTQSYQYPNNQTISSMIQTQPYSTTSSTKPNILTQEQMEAMIQSGQIKRGPNGNLILN